MTTYISQTKSGAWQVFTPRTTRQLMAQTLKSAVDYVLSCNDVLDFKVVYYKGYDFYKRKVGI